MKDSLRPVTFWGKQGYFHKWLVKKDEDGSEYSVALVEMENGTMQEVHYDSIKFVDN